MTTKYGEPLTKDEVLEIEVAQELGLSRPDHLVSAVFDATQIQGSGYRWPTKEEEEANNKRTEAVNTASDARQKIASKRLAEHYGVSEEALVRAGVQAPRNQTPAEAATAQERVKAEAKT